MLAPEVVMGKLRSTGMGFLAWGAAVLAAGNLAAADWDEVGKILGRPGLRLGGALVLEFPRTDLNVLLGGLALEPELASTCRFTFSPLVEGARLEGEWVLLEREVPGALERLEDRGFRVHFIRSPLLNASPGLRIVGVRAEGDARRLTRNLLKVLDDLRIPRADPPAAPAAPDPGTAGEAWGTWEVLQSHLGPGLLIGSVLEFNVIRSSLDPQGNPMPPLEMRLRFQRAGEDVACSGELHLAPQGVPDLLKELSKGDVSVADMGSATAPGKEALTSMRVWALGPAEEIGKTFQGILEGKN